jgi:hypothetical protein
MSNIEPRPPEDAFALLLIDVFVDEDLPAYAAGMTIN